MIYIPVDAVFNTDQEFGIIFVEKCNKARILQVLLFFITFFNKNNIKIVISVKNFVEIQFWMEINQSAIIFL